MSNVWIIGVGLVFVGCVAWGCRGVARWLRRKRRLRATVRPLRRGPGAFDANPWPDAPGVVPPRDLHRPADIDLTDPRILPPPREIRGRYGE
jgi:hypothetical protein